MVFTGEYEHTIDAKGRLAIPADIRAKWKRSEDGAAWYAVPWPSGVIRLYTEDGFEERADSGPQTLTPGEDEAELEATLFGMTARLEEDSAGRIRVPDDMREMLGLGTSIVLIGAKDRLEIHDRETWKKSKADRLARMPGLIRQRAARDDRGERRPDNGHGA